MAGKTVVNKIQLGDSTTATQNFVLQTNVDGTAKLARGNDGATTQDILTVDSSGRVTANQGIAGTVNDGTALGYGSGSGGTVTQTTSRTTAVTLNKPTGAITLFTAAGTATWQQFTVNNSLVSATDVVVLSVRSASNWYQCFVQGVSAGSFSIAFSSANGTASDTPVIQFAIIKGVAA